MKLKTIGIIHTCFKEKFGVPRQSGLISELKGTIKLIAPFNVPEIVKGLDGFSHIWILFLFHKNLDKDWSVTVRPPRLGGNRRVGVFSSRSPVRPNNIGMSAVRLDSIEFTNGQVSLHISGIDVIDQTPLIDIKPYLKDGDSIPDSTHGWSEMLKHKELFEIEFSSASDLFLKSYENGINLRELIVKSLKLDPRPVYIRQTNSKRDFAMKIFDCDIFWEVRGEVFYVTRIISTNIN